MNYLIISDIHGSEISTKKVLKYFNDNNLDKIIVLGDILYHGPRNDIPHGYNPKGVIALLNPLKEKIIAVRGNCEAEVDQMVLDFPCMSDYTIIDYNGKTIFATHGHLWNPDKMPPLEKGSIFLYGHTHLFEQRVQDGILICNPGSVTLPKENRPPTFATLIDGKIEIIELT